MELAAEVEVEGEVLTEGTFGEGVFEAFSDIFPGLLLDALVFVAVGSPRIVQLAVDSIGVEVEDGAEVVEDETSKMPEVRWSQ